MKQNSQDAINLAGEGLGWGPDDQDIIIEEEFEANEMMSDSNDMKLEVKLNSAMKIEGQAKNEADVEEDILKSENKQASSK